MLSATIALCHVTPTLRTFDKGVALDILRQAQSSPPGGPAGRRLQQVVDVLVVDLTEGNPNGELDVWLHLQADLVGGHAQHAGLCS